MSRESIGGIATRYRLDGPGIESWRGRDFPHKSRPALGPIQPPRQWVSFPGVKWLGLGAYHPLPSNAKIKEKLEFAPNPPPLGLHGLF
jgi:hypothetical protein